MNWGASRVCLPSPRELLQHLDPTKWDRCAVPDADDLHITEIGKLTQLTTVVY